MLKGDGKHLEMTRIKSLIIGCGKIAGLYENKDDGYVYSHAKALVMDKNYELVGCCDVDLENAKKLATIYGFKYFDTDYLKYIADYRIDVVSICTPDMTHYEIAMNILESKTVPRVIFIEKPVCNNEEELKKLLHLSEKRKVKLFINHTRRYDNKHLEIKRLIASGFFGKLFRADVYYYSGWLHNGVHVIDTLSFLFEDKLHISNLKRILKSPYEGDYTADFELFFEKSKVPVYLNGIDEKYYQLFEFDLKFEKGRLRIEDFGNRIIYERKVINEMHENVLLMDNLKLHLLQSSPIQNAYALIKEYVLNGDSLKSYTLEDISETMFLLWKGNQWIKKLI